MNRFSLMKMMLMYFEAKEFQIKAEMKKRETRLTRAVMMAVKITLSTALLFAAGLFAANIIAKG